MRADPGEFAIPANVTRSVGGHGRLDRLDQLIVAALQVNGRATWQQVAQVVGVSESTVSRRASRLLGDGTVRIVAVPDPIGCGLGHPVLLQVQCAVGASAAVARTMAARPDVRFVALLAGGQDIVVEPIVSSRAHLTGLLVDQLHSIPGITRTTTETVVRNFKTTHDWSRALLGDAASELTPDRSSTATPALDSTDVELMQLMSTDGRRGFADLAARLSISESRARRRVDTLLASEALRVTTLIDPHSMGFEWELFVWLEIEPGRLEQAVEKLCGQTEVRYVSATAGYSDLACEVVLRDQDDIYRFQTEVIGSIPGARRTEVGVELRTLKRAYLPMS